MVNQSRESIHLPQAATILECGGLEFSSEREIFHFSTFKSVKSGSICPPQAFILWSRSKVFGFFLMLIFSATKLSSLLHLSGPNFPGVFLLVKLEISQIIVLGHLFFILNAELAKSP